jgi:DNA replication and repair protein RecF
MKVARLSLRGFRNLIDCEFRPDPRLNFLVGDNGQGKTSILEALSYLATLRSFRGAKNDEVIGWGLNEAQVSMTLTDQGEVGADAERPWETELKVAFVREGDRAAKIAFINGKPFRSSTAYLSQRFGNFELGFHTIVFNPSDHDLVRGEPALRRAYLDRVLAAEDLEYLKNLQKYQRTLEQRNALLRSEQPPVREVVAGFTEPLVSAGSRLVEARLRWLRSVNPQLGDVMRQIAPRQPSLSAFYTSKWVSKIDGFARQNEELNNLHFAGQAPLPSLELLEQTFRTQLALHESAELRAGTTLIGPHRDDWAFALGDQPLKGHGSQGEVRSALLALKLSEISLFRERTGHRPLLLLDDFSSELDRERRSFLLRFLIETDLQVFITTTEDSSYVGKRYRVHGGQVEPAA